jgi:disulfide oxidoreductase YuzD
MIFIYMRTYSVDKYIYSVDMMLAYINIIGMKSNNVIIDDLLLNQLKHPGWGDPEGIKYSAIDVMNKPKKYKDDYERIENADLKYPIIMHGKNIVDGIHRLAKSYLMNKHTIKVYYFDNALMKKFIIGKWNEWDKVRHIESFDLIGLFEKRFKKEIC